MVSKDPRDVLWAHRDDEVNGPSRPGERETERSRNRENKRPTLLRRHTSVLRKSKKLRQNVLDGADFVRDVIDSYHGMLRFPIPRCCVENSGSIRCTRLMNFIGTK
jgi:hypothetical protein